MQTPTYDYLEQGFGEDPMEHHSLDELSWSSKNLNQDCGNGIVFNNTEMIKGIFKYDYIFEGVAGRYQGTDGHLDIRIIYNGNNTGTIYFNDYGLDETYNYGLTRLRNCQTSDGKTINLLAQYRFDYNPDIENKTSKFHKKALPQSVVNDIVSSVSGDMNCKAGLRLILYSSGSRHRGGDSSDTRVSHSYDLPNGYGINSITVGPLDSSTNFLNKHMAQKATGYNASENYKDIDILVHQDTYNNNKNYSNYQNRGSPCKSGGPQVISIAANHTTTRSSYGPRTRGFPSLPKASFQCLGVGGPTGAAIATRCSASPTNAQYRNVPVARMIRTYDGDATFSPSTIQPIVAASSSYGYTDGCNIHDSLANHYHDNNIAISQWNMSQWTSEDIFTRSADMLGRAAHYFWSHPDKQRFYYSYALVFYRNNNIDDIQGVIPGPTRYISQEMLPTVSSGNRVDWNAVAQLVYNATTEIYFEVMSANTGSGGHPFFLYGSLTGCCYGNQMPNDGPGYDSYGSSSIQPGERLKEGLDGSGVLLGGTRDLTVWYGSGNSSDSAVPLQFSPTSSVGLGPYIGQANNVTRNNGHERFFLFKEPTEN